MLHIGAEPNERWIGVMPSCKAEVRHPFPVPLVCWQGSIHWEEGPGLGARDTGGKVQVPQPICVRSSPGSKWAFGGNLLLSLMLQVWHLAEICKTGCWDCLCAHFPQDTDTDGVGANCAMLACFLSITFELKCLYCRWGMWVCVLRLYLLFSEMNISGDRFCRSTVIWCFCPPSPSLFN